MAQSASMLLKAAFLKHLVTSMRCYTTLFVTSKHMRYTCKYRKIQYQNWNRNCLIWAAYPGKPFSPVL